MSKSTVHSTPIHNPELLLLSFFCIGHPRNGSNVKPAFEPNGGIKEHATRLRRDDPDECRMGAQRRRLCPPRFFTRELVSCEETVPTTGRGVL